MAGDIVLITGASSGIGEALARRVARDGRNVGLVARRADRLEALASELRDRHGVDAHVFPCDLVAAGAVAGLVREVGQRGLTVDWLVNNAGFGTFGRFHELPVERELEEVRLVRRRRGTVMNISSVGGLFPGPFMSTYTATKAFVVAFSAGLEAELQGTGVSVLCVCPGFTRTEFQSHVDVDVSSIPALAWQSADEVADEAVRAAQRGGLLVNGRMNRVFTGLLGFLPRAWVTRASASVLRPRRAAH
jgi:short-subunit dehydrogenase